MDQDNQPTEPVDRDLLISRVVDDAASSADWQQLRALAEYDPSVWRELFEAQHAQAELAQAVQQAIAIADSIDAPIDDRAGPTLRFRLRKAGNWAGWALAASVAVVWMAPHVTPGGNQPPAPTMNTAGAPTGTQVPVARGVTSERNPGDFETVDPRESPARTMLTREESPAARPYRRASADAGTGAQQLAEMPERVLLEVRPLADGRLELIYVRRLIEKSIVNDGDLYQVKPDDAGIDRAVPYRTRRPSSGPI
ncbi:MAG: hypothetical protein ACIAS6_13255 [Phycisphaerales bacterium JB060]